jgi:hypothetical protein
LKSEGGAHEALPPTRQSGRPGDEALPRRALRGDERAALVALGEIEAEQDEYENIPWGVVRNVKSFDLLVVEHALKAVLRPHEAPFWLYHSARDFAGKTDVLAPSAAPIVEEIDGFWRKHFGLKR